MEIIQKNVDAVLLLLADFRLLRLKLNTPSHDNSVKNLRYICYKASWCVWLLVIIT